MTLLEQLLENKGTVSSALGKQLAKDALAGDGTILTEALNFIHYNNKNVRSGAAKIIEKIAEERSELVADHLTELLPCMNYPEAQTRWMVVHVAGLCATLNPSVALQWYDEAVQYLDKKHGTVLNDRAITYFGYIGSLSEANCSKAFPLLIECFQLHENRITRILESLLRMATVLNEEQKETLKEYIEKYEKDEKPSVSSWAKKLSKKLVL